MPDIRDFLPPPPWEGPPIPRFLAEQETHTSHRMTLAEAEAIYQHPKGHTTAELKEALNVLNESKSEIQLPALQFEAITDALRRLEEDARIRKLKSITDRLLGS